MRTIMRQPSRAPGASILAYDIETIAPPMPDGGFPPWPCHQPVAIGFAEARESGGTWTFDIAALVAADDTSEADLIRAADARMAGASVITSFNGAQFDALVLRLSAQRNRLWDLKALADHAAAHRYGGEHADLADLYASYGRKVGLAALCEQIGIPVKTGVSGGDVAALWEAGEHEGIRTYVAEDAVATLCLHFAWAAARAGDEALVTRPMAALDRGDRSMARHAWRRGAAVMVVDGKPHLRLRRDTHPQHGQLTGSGGAVMSTVDDGKMLRPDRPSQQRSDDMTTTKTLPMQVRHQNWMLALRELAGVPTFKPVNESILFCATGLDGIERGMELARLAQEAQRDIICAHWASTKAKRPSSYTVVLRDVLSVDVLSDCVAYMGGDDRLALVSLREKLTTWVGDRGLLQRGEGVPPHVARGARLAAMRIRKAAGGRDAGLLEGNRFMRLGGEWAAPDAPVDAPVRLS